MAETASPMTLQETDPSKLLQDAARSTLLHDDAWRIDPVIKADPGPERATTTDRDMARAARGKVRLLLALLVAVIVLQIYTLALSSVMKSIDTLGRDLYTAEQELRSLAAANVQEGSAVFNTTYARFGALQRNNQASQLILVRLATPWHWIFAPGEEQLASKADKDQAIESELRVRADDQGGRVMLQALALYVLPLLYGVLGASAFVLRALGQGTAMAHGALEQFRLRLALGALLGATVGLFFSSDTTVVGMTLSLVAIAFLAGYSVEFFFGLFDFVIAKVRDTVQPSESANRAAVPQTALVAAGSATSRS